MYLARLKRLTDSQVKVEDKMFATLDPSSRRLRFPREREIIITDTVGFIRDLPQDLVKAFRATLEELESADLFLHVIDALDPGLIGQIAAVENTLEQLGLHETPRILVLNKIDLLSNEKKPALKNRLPTAVMISAKNKNTFSPLLAAVENAIWQDRPIDKGSWAI